jgi:hypothetical protein
MWKHEVIVGQFSTERVLKTQYCSRVTLGDTKSEGTVNPSLILWLPNQHLERVTLLVRKGTFSGGKNKIKYVIFFKILE